MDYITDEKAKFLIDSMKFMQDIPSILNIKQSAIKYMLEVMTSSTLHKNILEAGCGHGADATIIAQLTNEYDSVVAVDSSKRMIEEATKFPTLHNVKYINCNILNLDSIGYKNYFDACHADRLLVSSSDPVHLFQGLLKLMKPDGVVAVTDVDALSIIIYPYYEITQIIIDYLQKAFVNVFMGRRLPDLFIQNGLQDIDIMPNTSMLRSFQDLCKIFQFEEIIASAVADGKMTCNDGKEWHQNMLLAEKAGKFIYCVTFFTVIGRMPCSQ